MSRILETRLRKVEEKLQPAGPLTILWLDSDDPAEEALRIGEAKAAGQLRDGNRVLFVRWEIDAPIEGSSNASQIH